MATKLTSKGQVTIPERIREYLGLKPGSAVSFGVGSSGDVIVYPTDRAAAAGEPVCRRAVIGHDQDAH